MNLRTSQQAPHRQPSPIVAAAQACFHESPYRTLRRISCKAEGGILVLEGRLNTFFEKQMAQEMAGRIKGVTQVDNKIEVVGTDGYYDD
jgi:osmotically-inducible protein OsmY